jgi:hypothetical protein
MEIGNEMMQAGPIWMAVLGNFICRRLLHALCLSLHPAFWDVSWTDSRIAKDGKGRGKNGVIESIPSSISTRLR